MKPHDLPTVWSAPDYRHMTPKQISLRLPLLVAAKIMALQGMYQHKTRTEIISDLLASALEQFEEALPSKKGNLMEAESARLGRTVYYDEGPKGTFRDLTRRYLKQLAIEAKVNLFDMDWALPYIEEELMQSESGELLEGEAE